MRIPNFVLHLMAAGIVGTGLMMIHPPLAAAATYSCGTASKGHCYGEASWKDETEIFAISTTVSPVNLYCAGCNGFVDDETWLVDATTPQCLSNEFGLCWVEVGFIREQGRKNTDFFWADTRPGHGFSQHWLGAINGVTDDLQFLIVKDTRQSAAVTTYLVLIADASLNAVVLHSGQSTKNSMVGKIQTIGQELYGSHGSAADPELFRQTQVSHLANQFAVGGALVNRATGGAVTDDKPPLGAWLVTPANLAGGAFATACCDASPPTPFGAKIPQRQGLELQRLPALLSQHHDAAGMAALPAPSMDARLVRMQLEKFLASQQSLGRVTLQGSQVASLEFLSARAASDKLDGLDVGVTTDALVILAELTGRFDVSGPRGARAAAYSKAQAVFDARSGNLLTLSLAGPVSTDK